MKLTLVDEKKKSTITTEAEETKRNALLVNRVESERERERAKKIETSARSFSLRNPT